MRMEVDYKDIGARVRAVRKRLGMTQERLAELADISIPHMSHIETGSTKVSLPTLIMLANAMDVSLDELVCSSIRESRQVYQQELAELFDACDSVQLRIILDVAKATKESLDRNAMHSERR